MQLATLPNTTVHILGENNTWADLSSRWDASNPEGREIRKLALLQVSIYPAEKEGFSLPLREDIRLDQEKFRDGDMVTKHNNPDGSLRNNKDVI